MRERTSQRISNRFRISLVFFSSHQRLLRRDEATQLLGRGLTSIADVSEQAQAESGEEQEEDNEEKTRKPHRPLAKRR